MGSGCDVPVLGGNVSICISSHPPSFEGAIENGKRDLLGHSDSSMLRKSPCFPVLLSLLVAPAIKLPCRRDLLIQTHSRLTHPKPEIFNLHAWLCFREVSRRQDFLKDLPRESVPLKELPHSLSTITVGTLGWIGVSNGTSVMALADFLIFLFEEKKLAPVSVKGYRSAISSTLKHLSSVDFSSDPVQ